MIKKVEKPIIEFKKLFRPIKIGKMEIKNRVVMLALTTGYNEADKTIGDRFVHYFVERAKGGAGLIIVPFAPVDVGSPLQPGLYHERFIPGARRLTDEIHAYGAKIAAQLVIPYHWVANEDLPVVIGPSPVFNQIMHCIPRSLTVKEIRCIVKECGKAAWRAREAGFDAVELLVGGGYLLNRFLSPTTNKRRDEYGGSLENRMRITVEIIESIMREAGEDYPIICRINVEEQMEGGHSIGDSKDVVRTLEGAGAQAINVYTGWHESPVPTIQASVPRGAFVYLAEKVKSWVSIPVITANRINDPILADKILAEGKADLIGMGRALLADPELPNKSREDRVDEIVPCIACSNCLAEIFSGYRNWGKPVSTFCTVNPIAGKEGEYVVEPAEISKNVLVIGGGPGGMEAAMTASMRGHHVTLYEKGSKLGGRLLIASIPPYKDEIKALVQSLVARTQKVGVEIKLNSEAGPETIEEEKPDVVILATGAIPNTLDIPGVHGDNVAIAEDVLTGRREASGAVLVIGGGMVGCETADFLMERGRDVTQVIILEMLERIATDVSPTYRPFLLARLRKAGVKMEPNTTIKEIIDKGVNVSRQGVSGFIKGDKVVLAVGFKANKQLVGELKGKVTELYSVGDCVKPRLIKEAIEEGFCIGREI